MGTIRALEFRGDHTKRHSEKKKTVDVGASAPGYNALVIDSTQSANNANFNF